MTSSPGHGLNEGKDYSLKLGSTFDKNSRAQESYHVLRCKYATGVPYYWFSLCYS